MYSPTKIVTIIKSIIAREVFCLHSGVKQKLWGGEFWTNDYFVNTVSKFGDENTISKNVREQGIEKESKILHKEIQLSLFLEGLQIPPSACGYGGVVH